MPRRTMLAGALALTLALPGLALGHAERYMESPPRPGAVPNQDRVPTAVLDVCKTGECAHQHIQAAVNAAPEGALIRIWPGFYKEEPSRVVPHGEPDNPDGTYSYDFHVKNPNGQNLIAIIGKKNLTLRGMGAQPRDVVIDVEFKKHVGIRGDRSDGLILENFSLWHSFDHGVYILETDGFIIDRVVSGYSREYPFLTFANDHGVMKNCEAFGGGDGGLYPGGAADAVGGKLGRYAMEIANCKSYHNVLGYSGTQGDNVWVHDSEFYDNAVGLVTDSETDHPNYPQNNLTLERNKFYNNNFNPYSADSDIWPTVFANSILIPVGVGVLLASGNDNLLQDNYIWGHDYYGAWLLNGVGLILGPGGPVVDGSPFAPPFVSEGNRFLANKMYNPASPAGSENAVDFGWDGVGLTNCWESNTSSPEGGSVSTNGLMLPPCSNPADNSTLPVTPGVPFPTNFIEQAGLLFIDTDNDGTGDTPICQLSGTCPVPYEGGPPLENARNVPEGYEPPPTPPTCGPSTCPASAASVKGTKTTFTVRGKAVAELPATGVPATTSAALAILGSAVLIGSRVRRRR
jgi:hypothetical protein